MKINLVYFPLRWDILSESLAIVFHHTVTVKNTLKEHIFPLSPSQNYWIDPVTHLVLGRIATEIIQNESVTLLLVHFRYFLLSTNKISPGLILIGPCQSTSAAGWTKFCATAAPLVSVGGTGLCNIRPRSPKNSVEYSCELI